MDEYEKAIEKMCRAFGKELNSHLAPSRIDDSIRAAAEAIGLREMMESLRNVIDYSRGTGSYNFRRLPEEDRDIARIEVWEKIQERIEAALTHRNPNP
jgi:hypothetical protein